MTASSQSFSTLNVSLIVVAVTLTVGLMVMTIILFFRPKLCFSDRKGAKKRRHRPGKDRRAMMRPWWLRSTHAIEEPLPSPVASMKCLAFASIYPQTRTPSLSETSGASNRPLPPSMIAESTIFDAQSGSWTAPGPSLSPKSTAPTSDTISRLLSGYRTLRSGGRGVYMDTQSERVSQSWGSVHPAPSQSGRRCVEDTLRATDQGALEILSWSGLEDTAESSVASV